MPNFKRSGNPCDNALPSTTQAESGWNTLKTELLPHDTAFTSLEEARLKGAYYLDTCFNRHRRHAALPWVMPGRATARPTNSNTT